MKKIPKSINGWQHHLVFKSLFVISCLLFSLSASAQQRDPVDAYASKHAETSLAKWYKADPDNQEVAHALKSAYVLSTKERNRYTASEIQIMEQEVSRMETYATEVNKLVSSGMNYGKASYTVQAQMQKASLQEKKSPQDTPAIDPSRLSSSPASSGKKNDAK